MKTNQHLARVCQSAWKCKPCQARQQALSITRRGFASKRKTADENEQSRLPTKPVRTRFAPSPTGNLHLGSIRTALFNYLLARRTNGQFLLRIEDTDQSRTVPGAEEGLYRDLRWAGLEWDEGPEKGGSYGPYRQSERLEFYQQHIEKLLADGKAYRCFCTADRINQLNTRRHDKGLALGYDRTCHQMSPDEAEDRASRGEKYVVRFIAPDQYPRYQDVVYGNSGHGEDRFKQRYMDEPVFDDPILMKSDGFPTYHFANVVDDHLMQISHVIRGSEWMTSTPLHVALYEAFGWKSPAYAHVPLLVDENKQKLSKRNFDSDIAGFRDKGVLSDAVNNFAVLLGWSHKMKTDIFTLQELESIFDLKITKGNTMVNPAKLKFIQNAHHRRLTQDGEGGSQLEQLIPGIVAELLKQHGAGDVENFVGKRDLKDMIRKLLTIESLPYRDAEQYAQQLDPFISLSPKLTADKLVDALKDTKHLKTARIAVGTLFLLPEGQWNRFAIRHHLKDLVFPHDIDPKNPDKQSDLAAKVTHFAFLRWALGCGPGIELPAVMEILGRDISEARLQQAMSVAKEVETASSQPNINVQKL